MRLSVAVGGLLILSGTAGTLHAQILETETAHLLPAKVWELAGNVEVQWSDEGKEIASPIAISYGLTDRLELMAEPVLYTAIRPNEGASATGLGDLEMTLTYLAHPETSVPGIALAGEVKLPTARDDLIGTKETDYAAYLIASKRLGKVDVHANLSYTVPGSPPDLDLHNMVGGALAAVAHLTTRTDLFGEVLANTSALPGEQAESSTSPEVAGNEAVGTVGMARSFGPGLQVALSASYDNNSALLVRPSVVYRF